MKVLVYTGPKHAGKIVEERLGHLYEVRLVDATPEDLLPHFYQASIFMDASMKVPITAEDVARAEHLELIVTATTGANHISGSALEARLIPLLTLKGETKILRDITASAELSWALLMSCARNLGKAFSHVRKGLWERTEFPGMMLRGKILGVIGFGRNGSWMARYGTAFGMKVLAYDPYVKAFPDHAMSTDIDTLLAQSDFVSLHVHLNEENHHLLNADKIDMMKSGAVFINTSRGELVDEYALVAALKDGRIAGVGCDVLTDEPDIQSNVLWQFGHEHDNVHITPHIGGFCPSAVEHVVNFSAGRVLAHAEDKS